ncbi:MAG: glycosyltransferase family 4 protein [Paludibacteraceae bacterium]
MNKLHTIYNGVNFDKLKTPLQPVDFLGKKDCISPRLQLAMVGNFVRVRAQNFVCQFLHLLHQQGVVFDFYFVGSRANKESWRYDDCVAFCQEHHLMDCVHFVGSRNDVPHILRQIDAFVYATDHDTFGIAVVEAIAAGIPVFVNDWGVMREITHNGEWATLYRTNDIQDLLRQFICFIDHRETFRQHAVANAEYVQHEYSIEQHLSSLKRLYHTLS